MPEALPFQLSEQVKNLRPSATLFVNEKMRQMVERGETVYRFGFGQSPFPVPPLVVEALRANASEKDYLPVRGLMPLRQAVAEHTRREVGLDCSADDILIGPGSKELIFNAQMALDADLLLPAPSWVSYAPQAHLLRKKCTWLATSEKDGWRLLPETLAAACRQNGRRAKLLILNYPNNPTGHTYPADWLAAIAETARAHGVTILADEIYGLASHSAPHVSIAKFYPEGTLLSSGLSKWAGAGGWRLGTCVFPKNMRWLLDAMAGIASETFSAVAAPIQHAAVTAFSDHPGLVFYRKNMRRVLRVAAQFIYEKMSAFGLDMPAPEGGFYLFPNFEKHRGHLSAMGIRTSAELCEVLLEKTGVALLPGSAFGRPEAELTARLSYVDFDGAAALAAAAEMDGEELGADFIGKYCPQFLPAMEAVRMFFKVDNF